MKTNVVITAIISLFVGLSLGFFMWSNDKIAVSQPRFGQGIDQHFILQMIPHHQSAIEMSKVALERSKRAEILELANNIIQTQEKENADMRAWYLSWFGSIPQENGMGMMNMNRRGVEIEALKAVSDAEFDRLFIEQMIPHHEMAIMMAQMLKASTQRDEMRELAENIISSQSREINMMTVWLESWY